MDDDENLEMPSRIWYLLFSLLWGGITLGTKFNPTLDAGMQTGLWVIGSAFPLFCMAGLYFSRRDVAAELAARELKKTATSAVDLGKPVAKSHGFPQPLEQFNVDSLHEFTLFDWVVSFTNYWLVCVFILTLVTVFLIWPLKYNTLIPSNWGSLLESIYLFLVKLFSQHVNNSHSLYYFPAVSTIFIIVLFSNLLGLMPYNFTITSHIFTTLTLSLTMFIGTIIISLYYNKLNYFKFFVPKGIDNKPLKYFLVFIEIISYIIRPFSLAIRLFANMLAGHTLLYILNTFLVYVSSKKIFALFLLPMAIIFMVFMLEFAIAFIQAYVFTTLLVIYINDIYNVSH